MTDRKEDKPQEPEKPRRAVEMPPVKYGVPPKYVGPKIPLWKPTEKS